MSRAVALSLLAFSIAIGLASRKLPLGVAVWDKSLGDVLYAVAMTALLAVLRPGMRAFRTGALAFAACLAIELFQLTGLPARAPSLLRFVLGTTFAWHDVGCYALGAAVVSVVAESRSWRHGWVMRGLAFVGSCLLVGAAFVASCKSSGESGSSSGGSSGSPAPNPASPTATVEPVPDPPFDNGGRVCTGVTRSTAPDETDAIALPPQLVPAAGFTLEAIARVPAARHIAALANGDLLVGTNGSNVYLVPHADTPKAGKATVFTTLQDAPVHGVTFHEPTCAVYVAGQTEIHRVPYDDTTTTAELGEPIARVRPEGKGGHTTTSVAVAGGYLFASVGSTCNDCDETDPTRATVQRMALDGSGMTTYAKRIRNPIALTTHPETKTLWAGVAGQDGLPEGHPYEFFDAISAHPPVADYGWPHCEENRKAYTGGTDCSQVVVPRVVLPAYSTLVGAAFYPKAQAGANALPDAYKGGVFIVARGAWHQFEGKFYSPPRVVFVRMNGDTPEVPVDWADPSKQWREIVSGFESADRTERYGRPTGIAVGRDGSLFVADDTNGLVYRIRPAR